MFWVISTAFVLHGVTIAARGPTKKSAVFVDKADFSILGWLPKSHDNFFMFSSEIFLWVWTAKTVFSTFPKK